MAGESGSNSSYKPESTPDGVHRIVVLSVALVNAHTWGLNSVCLEMSE
jgi:hypothetical protein